jgi:hypothetical protein
VGTRLAVGTAVVEITAEPHLDCGKFSRRFGVDALKFVNSAAGRELNLRGVNARIVRAGGGSSRRPDRRYGICRPEIARAMTRRWISDVPSKIV